MLGLCVGAIYAAYITQGVVQENVSTRKYGEKGERFEHLTFLQLAQSVVCLFWSLLMLQVWPNTKGSQAPAAAYLKASLSNAIGPACGIVALKYISYPAQVLAKSSKMIPVMFMGALVYGVQYSLSEYLSTFLVAGGVSMFALFKSSKKVASKLSSPNAPLGYTLCFLNLGLDGFTNAAQDSITKKYPGTNAWHIMYAMNLWGSIYMSIYMFGLPGGGGWEAVKFMQHHPVAAWDIMLFCLCGAVGQNFIFLTISRFGALTNTTITTTRKFVSILVSSIWNGNHLSLQQWAGVIMVFTGLMYQIYLKWRKRSAHKKTVVESEKKRE